MVAETIFRRWPVRWAAGALGVLVSIGLSTSSAGSVNSAVSMTSSRVGIASAPVAQTTAYAVVGMLATPAQAGNIVVLNNQDADATDDTIFLGVPTNILAFRPGATTGSVGSSLGLTQSVRALAGATGGLYAVFSGPNELKRFPTTSFGSTSPLASTGLAEDPESVAVGGQGTATQADDSAYVVYYNNRNRVDGFSRDLASTSSAVISLANSQPTEVAVGGSYSSATGDDSVYVVGNALGSGAVVQLTPTLGGQSSLQPGFGLSSVATYDDSLILGPYAQAIRVLRVTNWDDSVTLGVNGGYVAVNRWAVVGSVDHYSSKVSFVTLAGILDDTIPLNLTASSARDIAFSGDGVAYVTYSSSQVAVIDKVTSASPSAPSGAPGSALQVSLTLQSGRLMDDSTVEAVWFGDQQASFTRVGGSNAVNASVPAGAGSVALTVALRGGNAIDAGTFTFATAPPPAVPATAPEDVVAVAGDGQATVSWSPPASSGSYAISTYQAIASPGGRMCLTSGLSCTVDGLTNGTTYTFTVKALTGAGWSTASEPSNAVVPRGQPQPSITITGSRDGQRIQVLGSTVGLGMGAILNPWVKLAGQPAYSQGSAQVLVGTDRTFEWGRNARRNASVYMQAPDGSVRSNTIQIR